MIIFPNFSPFQRSETVEKIIAGNMLRNIVRRITYLRKTNLRLEFGGDGQILIFKKYPIYFSRFS